jgi:hypothetical protein
MVVRSFAGSTTVADRRQERTTLEPWRAMRWIDPRRLVFLDEADANLAMGHTNLW